MARHNDFGQDSETIARSFLLKKGYSILESNWRSGHKEIDIIAKDGEMLVIVEVKARNVNSPQPPEDAVDERKIRNLVRAADAYIQMHNLNIDTRFDIVTIVSSPNGLEINHIEDAFYPPINI